MKKIVVTIVIVLMLTACERNMNDSEPFISEYARVYCVAFDELMNVDEGLNDEAEYIAINFSTLQNISDEDERYISDYMLKHNDEILDESFSSLEEKGMVKEFNYIEGLLIEVIDVSRQSDTSYEVEVSKFRSGIGAVGMRYTIEYIDEEWTIIQSTFMWIS